ncbi:MAG: rRNA pseudouridine synthase [Verrucomicrobiae bacterium]|nr:rRNA pseudouridine synthase [Verrucomicrobiae bacterium]
MPIRLQKFLAEGGVASRRQCEELIRGGRIRVNGETVTAMGLKVSPVNDRILVDGKPVASQKKLYVALNKPAGYLCTSKDTHGRHTVFDLLPKSWPRLHTVGRLDYDTEGLLLLTNDGDFSLHLTHPRYKVPKQYEALINGILTSEQSTQLTAGMLIDNERMKADAVTNVRCLSRQTRFELVLTQGINRQIRRMLSALGHRVVRLKRLNIGSIELGSLKTGRWRFLTSAEVRKLEGRRNNHKNHLR